MLRIIRKINSENLSWFKPLELATGSTWNHFTNHCVFHVKWSRLRLCRDLLHASKTQRALLDSNQSGAWDQRFSEAEAMNNARESKPGLWTEKFRFPVCKRKILYWYLAYPIRLAPNRLYGLVI